MNKRIFPVIFILILCGAFLEAQTLDEAILNAAIRIGRDLPAGATVSVISFDSNSETLNDYVISELHGAILRNRRVIPVRPDQNPQHRVTGSIEPVDSEYRIVITAVNTEKAELSSEYSASLNPQNDTQLALLLGASTVSASLSSQQESLLAPQGGNNYRGSFTISQRVGTCFLNILPGVGSYAIMHDIMGGTILLLSGATGWALFAAGVYTFNDKTYTTSTNQRWNGYSYITTIDTNVDEDKEKRGIALMIVGGVILAGNGIFNIARSATYNKPKQPNRMSLLSPEAWQIAVLPGKGGIEAAALSYTIRY